MFFQIVFVMFSPSVIAIDKLIEVEIFLSWYESETFLLLCCFLLLVMEI